ncbi:MAG: hypothetical protein JEZ12_14875 [Desulfobacterium sp.]|nr:hypothetical protein [Desulfobacterium sp.]
MKLVLMDELGKKVQIVLADKRGEDVAEDEYSNQSLAVDLDCVSGGDIDLLQWGDQP